MQNDNLLKTRNMLLADAKEDSMLEMLLSTRAASLSY